MTALYKPKTALISSNEKNDLDDFYFLEAERYLFRGRISPGQLLYMRKGLLADTGDIVQVASSNPSVCMVAEYQDGMDYSSVCVGVVTPENLLHEREKKLPKEYYRVVSTLNNVERYSPWFSSCASAFKAMNIIVDKYGCEAGVYFSHYPVNVSTGQGGAA